VGRPPPTAAHRSKLAEPLSDPLGGLATARPAPAATATRTVPAFPSTSGPVARTALVRAVPAKRVLAVDPARERAIHEELMQERDRADWERTRLLFVASAVCALVAGRKFGFDGQETIIAMLVCTPLVALAGWLLKQCAGFLPALNERMMTSVVVAIMVGIGAFTLFFEDGTMGRLYEGGHPGVRRPR
jgi:hypothetical protein